MKDREIIDVALDACRKLAAGEVSAREAALRIANAVYSSDTEPELPEFFVMAALEDEYGEFGKDYRIQFYGEQRARELQLDVERKIIETAKSILAKYA
ncbi:hypothetical protein ACJO2E_03405 [Marinobacter sp. M1N3S26]|uniref:hypothetical protein n=1 Tax=Marinobacter sp. M1N3S26 TaxID=3382299 RepID=UPI00387B2A63